MKKRVLSLLLAVSMLCPLFNISTVSAEKDLVLDECVKYFGNDDGESEIDSTNSKGYGTNNIAIDTYAQNGATILSNNEKELTVTETDIEADTVFNTNGYASVKINEKYTNKDFELEALPQSALADKNGNMIFPYKNTWLRYHFDEPSKVVSLVDVNYMTIHYKQVVTGSTEGVGIITEDAAGSTGGWGIVSYVVDQPEYYDLSGSVIKGSGFFGGIPMHEGYAVIIEKLPEPDYNQNVYSTVKLIDSIGNTVYTFPDRFGVPTGGRGDQYWGEEGYLNEVKGYSDGLIVYIKHADNWWEFPATVEAIDKNGNIVFASDKYSFINCFHDGLATVGSIENDKYGFISKSGEEIIACQFDTVTGFNDGYSGVSINGKYGYIDKTGKIVIPLEYDDVYGAGEDLFSVVKDGKCGLVDINNQVVVPLKYDDISSFDNGVAYAIKNRKVYIIKYTEPEIVDSGKCGDNLTWTLDEEGTLTISGKGEMYDYSFENIPPWSEYSESIKVINIGNGVTSIGACAFPYIFSFSSLEKIVLPETLVSMDSSSFVDIYSDNYKIGPIGSNSDVEYGWKTSIPDEALCGLYGYPELLIPKNIVYLGYHISDAKYDRIYYSGTQEQWNELVSNSEAQGDVFNEAAVVFVNDCFIYGHKVTEIHNQTDATCCEDGYTGDTYCIDCGEKTASGTVILATGNHTDADGKWETDGTKHWHTCYHGTIFDEAEHSGGMATCINKAVCQTCNSEYGEKLSHSYKTTTAKATLTSNGKIETKCSVCGNVKSSTAIAYPKTFTLSTTKFTYTGKEIKPTVTVKDSNGKVVSSSNYTVSYSGNVNAGTGKVTVTFKGNYSGTKTVNFTITPKQTTGLKVSDEKTTSLKLTWSKTAGAKYYKVEQSTDGKKWKTVTTTDKTSYTVKSLKAGTKYQFRVTALDSTKKIAGKASSVLKTGTLTSAPTLTLKSTKSKTATASWKKVTGASKYVVYKSTNGKKWTKVTTTTKTSYNLTKLTGGKKIYVKVKAVNAYSKASAYSSTKNVTVKK